MKISLIERNWKSECQSREVDKQLQISNFFNFEDNVYDVCVWSMKFDNFLCKTNRFVPETKYSKQNERLCYNVLTSLRNFLRFFVFFPNFTGVRVALRYHPRYRGKKRLRIERHCQVNNIGSGTQIIRCTVVSKEFSSSSERLVDLPSRSWRLIKPVAFKAYLRFQAYLRCSRIKYCLLQIIVCTCIRTRAMR